MMKPTIRTDYHAVFSRNKGTPQFSMPSFLKPALIFAMGFLLGMGFKTNVSKPSQEMVASADVKANQNHSAKV